MLVTKATLLQGQRECCHLDRGDETVLEVLIQLENRDELGVEPLLCLGGRRGVARFCRNGVRGLG